MTRNLARFLAVATAVVTMAPTIGARAAGDDRLGQNGPYSYTQHDFWISDGIDPDDMGNPVQLDARVLIPNGAGPFPGLLINHGYLGDKGGDGDTAAAAARNGYIVLRYSSRGFGASRGQVDLVGTKETRDMLTAIHWLNNPANVPIWVDHIAHYGGSYGGAHDYNLAMANDPAVKALVAAATWTDLYDGLLPNNVLKISYETGFYAAGRALGVADGDFNPRSDPNNNYSRELDVMEAKVAAGVDLDGVHTLLKKHSVVDKWDRIHQPMFIIQGLNDGLFDGNSAIQSYQELKNRNVPVRLYLGGIGHPPARASGGPEIAHLMDEVNAWLDHYVRGIDNGIDRAAPIEFAPTKYFENDYLAQNHAITGYPFGWNHGYNICPGMPGRGTLTTTPCTGLLPTVLAAGTGGDPVSEPVVGKQLGDGWRDQFGSEFPSLATRVDVARYDSEPMAQDTLLAGIPKLSLKVISASIGDGAPTTGAALYQVDPKVYDLAPDGTATLITRGAYSEMPAQGAGKGLHTAAFDAFAFAWTFKAGHRLRLSLSSADFGYLKPNSTAFEVAIMSGSQLLMPGAEYATAPVYPALLPAPAPQPAPPLPNTGGATTGGTSVTKSATSLLK
ncbi:MAG: type transport system ATP-binding protein [Chloroflexota bacterium]|jgi:ABC-2 type transport system ATP-binding protein|nr:type transport system ATP-binding protein [Chloroflexota bacterium]